MKTFIALIAFILTGMPAMFAVEQSKLARVTVYWASGGGGSDRYTRQHKTATGLRLRTGHCAVDPRHIPYGSKVVFPDGTALAAVDTGTAVRTRKAARRAGRTITERNALVVDRFFETKRQALVWARTHPLFMPVKIVLPTVRTLSLPQPQLASTTRTSIVTTTTRVTSIPATQAVAATTNSARPSAYPLLAASDTMARNPLNKSGR
jgi:3D (Asp-Asp-Asp) domain-containing protein